MTSKSFTSWKLDLLNAACMDGRLKPVSVRLLLRLVESLSEDTWDSEARTCTARIGDDVIADEIPGLKDRQTIRDHRKALAAAGWLTFDSGHGSRATVYRLSDAPANAMLDRRIELRAARLERREAERLARIVTQREGGKRPLISPGGRGQTSPSRGDVHPPVHLTSSPSAFSLPAQDMAPGAFDPETGEIPPPAAREGTRPVCDECGRPAVIRCELAEAAYCETHSWLATREASINSADAYAAASRGD